MALGRNANRQFCAVVADDVGVDTVAGGIVAIAAAVDVDAVAVGIVAVAVAVDVDAVDVGPLCGGCHSSKDVFAAGGARSGVVDESISRSK